MTPTQKAIVVRAGDRQIRFPVEPSLVDADFVRRLVARAVVRLWQDQEARRARMAPSPNVLVVLGDAGYFLADEGTQNELTPPELRDFLSELDEVHVDLRDGVPANA